jgi:hypothetical protein
MGLVSTIIKHRSTIFAVASGACTLAALYFMHEETKQDVIDRPEETFIEPKDKVVYFVKHYTKTGLAAIASLGFMIATKRLDAIAIAGLTSTCGLLSTQTEDLKEVMGQVLSDEDIKKVDNALNVKNMQKATRQQNIEAMNKINWINVYYPAYDIWVYAPKERFTYADYECTYSFDHHSEAPIWYYFELLGKDIKKFTKEQNAAIEYQGWWATGFDERIIKIRTNFFYNEKKNRLEAYFDWPNEPFTDPDAPIGKGASIFNRDHDENQYRDDKIKVETF